jgi:hypothetical protein
MSSGPQDVKGHEILQQVAAQAVDDTEFRQRLLDDPKSVLREAGLKVGDEVNLVVHENTRNDVHLVLPSHPADAARLDIDEINVTLLNCGIHF